MTTDADLEPVPFDDPPIAASLVEKNGSHESFENSKPVAIVQKPSAAPEKPLSAPLKRTLAPVLSQREAHDAIQEGIEKAKTMDGGEKSRQPGGAHGRMLPHSIEAEENLLSACLIDGQDVVARCIDAKITPASFYDTKHGIIFDQILTLFREKKPIDAAIVAEELKSSKQLDKVGGVAFIMQVSGRVATTAQANYYIKRVSEQATLREIIRAASGAVEDCYNFSSGIEDFGVDIRRRMEFAIGGTVGTTSQRMDWDELLAFDPKKDPECLMGNRFLGRTGALVIVAPSGVGKSVLGFQLGACAALQRVFFSLRMVVPMRVLYLQAEDDFGDVAEAVQGFTKGYDLSPDELKRLKANLRIERWNDVSGDKFLAKLKRFHAAWPFDLVILNPLFAFAGCNISEQKELSPFLRNGLNPILNETRAAAIIIHHTNKPPQDPGAQDKAMDAELRYVGSGSAELTNWARAYITLQGVRAAGDHVHKMVFVKRGNRAGIVDEEGKPSHSIFIEHSKTGLCWMPSAYTTEKKPGGKFLERFDLSRALGHFDSSKTWSENESIIAKAMNMDPRTIRRHKQAILDNG